MDVGGMIGGGEAYNRIKSGHTASMLQEEGYDAERAVAGGAFNTAGQTGAAEKTRAAEEAEGMDYAQTLAEGGMGRNLKFFTDANFMNQEAARNDQSLMNTYQESANFRKAVNENGYENIAVDLDGNVVGREGVYSKMRVDTDQDGVGMEMTNVKYNSATGDLEGMYNGKHYKMRGEFLDADGSDGMISMKPAEAEWTSTHQRLDVNGQELTGVQVRGFGLGNQSSMKIEGSTMIDGEMKKVNAFGQGDIKQGEHGAYAAGNFSVFDADSSFMTTNRAGTDNQLIDRDTTTVDKGLRQETGNRIKAVDTIETDFDSKYNGTYRKSLTDTGSMDVAEAVWNNASIRSNQQSITMEEALKFETAAQNEDYMGTVGKFFSQKGQTTGEFSHMESFTQIASTPKLLGFITLSASAQQGFRSANTESSSTDLLMASGMQNAENVIASSKGAYGAIDRDTFLNSYSESLNTTAVDVQKYLEGKPEDFGKDSVLPQAPGIYQNNAENPAIADKINEFEKDNSDNPELDKMREEIKRLNER